MTNASTPSSNQQLWRKIQQFSRQAGREVIEKALTLYYAAQRPETPLWAKAVIISALAYLILPTDAIPDMLPVAGYTDDLSTLIAALSSVALAITPEVKQAARHTTEAWFGREPAADAPSTPEDNGPIRVIPID